MANNYNKSFNFRNGVQVDDDNFVVNPNGLVGIGTSLPTESLDVYGTAKITGLVTATSISTPNLNISGIATITTLKVGIVTANSGIATYYGDGSKLLNLPTSQWIDVNTGIGVTSIYAAGAVGVATNFPTYYFQVGSNPDTQSGVGINSTGSIKASGIITASSFNGSGANIILINADNISSGTLSNSRLPSNINVSGIITATSGLYGTLTGDVVGIASTANSITTTANITVNSINSGFSTTGISTIYTTLNVPGKIGVGTLTPSADINIRRTGISSIQLTSDGSYESTITFGRNINFSTNNAQIRFGNTNLSYSSSTEQSLDIINYDTGNINFYLNPGGAGTGSFIWFKPSLAKSMVLTSSGNLGINSNSPTDTLSIVGTADISGNVRVGGALTVTGSFFPTNITVSGNTILLGTVGIATNTPLYSLQIGKNPLVDNGIGISSTGNIVASGTLTIPQINVTGIITTTNLHVSEISTISVNSSTDALRITQTGSGNALVVEDESNPDATPFVISQLGSVGIGTVLAAGSNHKLVVHDGFLSITNAVEGSGFLKGLVVGYDPTSDSQYVNSWTKPLVLNTSPNTSSVILQPTGANRRVGIGSTIPNNKLDVIGNTYISGNLGIATANPTSKLTVEGDGIFSGIITATNGFTSGIGTAVQITTIGNRVIFTVVGVGSTSLTLF